MDNKIYFLCDGEKEDCKRTYCYKNTDDTPCKRTSDINHAKNFEKMPHGGYREKEDGKTWEEEIEEKERESKSKKETLNGMDEMVSEIDKAIEKKYQEIRESGRVYRGINKLYEDLCFEKTYLAMYVRRKMMELAEEKGDL